MTTRSTGTPASVAAIPGAEFGTEGAALVLDDVSKRFGGLVAVSGVSFILPVGGRLAVIGPNGAGKTTLFRVIAGEMRASGGTIALFGEDVTTMSERRRALKGVSRTFQVSNLFPSLSVAHNVRLAAQVATPTSHRFWTLLKEKDAFGGRVEHVLEQVGLQGRAADTVAELSHGEKRQLEIAMALIAEPKLILLDEPAAGLSGAERVVLRDLLERLPAELTFLLIEHDMTLALELVDRVLCLDNGVPLAYGTPEHIRANPSVQAVYLGRRD
ncbi:MAG TPA: ABC transporter ATP-binding protein [Terrimesophilobacter sp.]|nr:ABC transporter ATP-binding protein [Terrimesophilobacter sp.]